MKKRRIIIALMATTTMVGLASCGSKNKKEPVELTDSDGNQYTVQQSTDKADVTKVLNSLYNLDDKKIEKVSFDANNNMVGNSGNKTFNNQGEYKFMLDYNGQEYKYYTNKKDDETLSDDLRQAIIECNEANDKAALNAISKSQLYLDIDQETKENEDGGLSEIDIEFDIIKTNTADNAFYFNVDEIHTESTNKEYKDYSNKINSYDKFNGSKFYASPEELFTTLETNKLSISNTNSNQVTINNIFMIVQSKLVPTLNVKTICANNTISSLIDDYNISIGNAYNNEIRFNIHLSKEQIKDEFGINITSPGDDYQVNVGINATLAYVSSISFDFNDIKGYDSSNEALNFDTMNSSINISYNEDVVIPKKSGEYKSLNELLFSLI